MTNDTRRGFTKTLSVSIAILAFSASIATGAGAQPNWRLVESFNAGRFSAKVEVSSERTLRLISAVDDARLIGPSLTIDSIQGWNQRLFHQIDNPTSREYVLGNAVLVQPFLGDSGKVRFLLTVADTIGESRQVIMDKGGLEDFLDLLEAGTVAGRTLTDAELKKAGPIVATPVALAKPYTAVYPRTARLVGVTGTALVQFVVDTTGRAEPSTINCISATYKDFADAAQLAVLDMIFTPATMDGHKIERLVQIPFEYKIDVMLPVNALSLRPPRRR